MDITYFMSLQIEIIQDSGDYIVYGAYWDSSKKCFDKVTKSIVKYDRKGHAYFKKSDQRFYLADFMKKTPF